MIRISDIVRVIENTAITAGAEVGHAAGTFYSNVSKEYRARQMYAVESAAPRKRRLEELRAVVEQADALTARSQADELAELRAQLAALQAQVKATKRKARRV